MIKSVKKLLIPLSILIILGFVLFMVNQISGVYLMVRANNELAANILLGVMIAINLQTSFLTPPFGFALFYLRGVAPAQVETKEIYKGVIPFVLIQLSLLFLLAWYPDLATRLPEILYS